MNVIMRFWMLLLFLIFSSFRAGAEIPFLAHEYDSSKWPTAHLRLSQAGTLKDVFDSGLRPYRFPSLERTTLEVKHVRMVIELESGKTLPEISTEWMNIKMFNDGELAHMEGATPSLDLLRAKSQMEKWLRYDSAGKTEADLDSYLKAVEVDPLDFDDPYRGRPDGCAITWREPGQGTSGGGAQCSVWFRKTFSQKQPLRIYFKFSWGANRPQKDRKGYRIPIPPPPGYEHVSMDAPKNFGPDSGANILRAQGVDIGESKEARDQWRRENGFPPIQEDSVSRDSVNLSRSNDSLAFIRWAIIAAIGLLAVVFGFRKWSARK